MLQKRGSNLNMRQIAKNVVVQILRGYKWAISPMFPPACRYVPTCSEYAMEAIEGFGILRGSMMALWRLLRCHPFVKGGYDPVPRDTKADVEERTVCHHGPVRNQAIG
jgi:uncharacterized protein